MAADTLGNIFIADANNRRIRKLSPDGIVTTVAGTGEPGHRDGPAEEATFGVCVGIAVGDDGTIYVSDYSYHVIRKISGVVSTLAGKTHAPGLKDGKGEGTDLTVPKVFASTFTEVSWLWTWATKV